MCRTPVGRERDVSDSTLRQIAALGGLSAAELKDRWRDLNGTEPPRYNRDFLLKRLAHRIQVRMSTAGETATTGPWARVS